MEKKLQGDIQWWQGKGHTAFCGSVNEQTRKQIKYAEEKGVFTYKLPLDILISSSLPEYEMDHILSMQKEKKEILFYTVSGGGDIERTVRAAKQMGLSQKETYKKVAERLGQIASICMRAGNRRNFTVIGGDTLCETMKAADYRKIEPLAELYPGVILAKIYYKKGDERFVVSKAGSFGDDTIIWKIFRKAGGQSRN